MESEHARIKKKYFRYFPITRYYKDIKSKEKGSRLLPVYHRSMFRLDVPTVLQRVPSASPKEDQLPMSIKTGPWKKRSQRRRAKDRWESCRKVSSRIAPSDAATTPWLLLDSPKTAGNFAVLVCLGYAWCSISQEGKRKSAMQLPTLCRICVSSWCCEVSQLWRSW